MKRILSSTDLAMACLLESWAMCSDDECERPSVSRGMCDAHYRRAMGKRHGQGPIRVYGDVKGRLLQHISVDPGTGCWVWTGSLHRTGYGRLMFGPAKSRRARFAHRVSYEVHVGPIPDGMYVLHRCDNPPCVNPEHLSLGTQFDNMGDAATKGRVSRGEARHNVRLTAEQARSIREDPRGHTAVAREYGVGYTTVKAIRDGRTWKHV